MCLRLKNSHPIRSSIGSTPTVPNYYSPPTVTYDGLTKPQSGLLKKNNSLKFIAKNMKTMKKLLFVIGYKF